MYFHRPAISLISSFSSAVAASMSGLSLALISSNEGRRPGSSNQQSCISFRMSGEMRRPSTSSAIGNLIPLNATPQMIWAGSIPFHGTLRWSISHILRHQQSVMKLCQQEAALQHTTTKIGFRTGWRWKEKAVVLRWAHTTPNEYTSALNVTVAFSAQ